MAQNTDITCQPGVWARLEYCAAVISVSHE